MNRILDKIWQGWKKIAHAIGKVNTRILLTLFYFIIIGFVALIKNIIKVFSSKSIKDSNWILADKNKAKSDFEQQF